MTRLMIRRMLAVGGVLILGSAGCTKPASPDSRQSGTQSGVRSAPGRYTIGLDRRKTVGLRYRLETTGAAETFTRLNGKLIKRQSKKMTYAFGGVITVKSLHPSGRFSKASIRITKLRLTRGGRTKDLLPPGTVVLGETQRADSRFTVNGKAVARGAHKVLRYVFSLYAGVDTSLTELIGPGGPKNPGDTWKPNFRKVLALFKKLIRKPALLPKPSDVTGKVTFVAVKKMNGIDCAFIKSYTRVNNISPSFEPLPATSGHMELLISGWVPADPALVVGGTLTAALKMHAASESTVRGKSFRVVMDHRRTQTSTETALP